MKHILLIAILASFFSGAAFAEETATECPMMAERNERENPKQDLQKKKEKQSLKSATAQ